MAWVSVHMPEGEVLQVQDRKCGSSLTFVAAPNNKSGTDLYVCERRYSRRIRGIIAESGKLGDGFSLLCRNQAIKK
jgi:hypothetical protein